MLFMIQLDFILSLSISRSPHQVLHAKLSPIAIFIRQNNSFLLSHFRLEIVSNNTHNNNRIAAAFTTVVTSFVSEILLPPLSLIPGIHRNMDSKFAILRRGPNYNKTMSIGYNTQEQAAADGAVVMAYGYVFIFSHPT